MKLRRLSALAACVLLSSCGGSGSTSSSAPIVTIPTATTPPTTPIPPAPITYTSATLSKSYQIQTASSSDVVPEYVYGGVTNPRGIADIFPQGSISVDFQKDRFPELIVPLNKAYGTPAFARLPYLYPVSYTILTLPTIYPFFLYVSPISTSTKNF